jgi:hypothetical protein
LTFINNYFYHLTLKIILFLNYIFFHYKLFMGIGDWGLGIGDLGVGAKTQNPNPKTQTPHPKKG